MADTSPVIYKAFTMGYDSIVSSLRTAVEIDSNGKLIRTVALWDTGAMRTCISHGVVAALSLVPTGRLEIHTPNGSSTTNTHIVNVHLPNNVVIDDVMVCDTDIGAQGIGMLIGMDVIYKGDFAISNFDGKTVFTFRMPSKQVTDYAKQITASNAIGAKHGKGNKKRR